MRPGSPDHFSYSFGRDYFPGYICTRAPPSARPIIWNAFRGVTEPAHTRAPQAQAHGSRANIMMPAWSPLTSGAAATRACHTLLSQSTH